MNKEKIDYELTAVQLYSLLSIMENMDENTPTTDIKFSVGVVKSLADVLYCAIANKELKEVEKICL